MAYLGIMRNIDPTENMRREMINEINSQVTSDETLERMRLEATHGKGNVWNTHELQERFEVRGFLAPFCSVTEKATGKQGLVMFQHNPRFYFGFQPS